MNCKELYDLYNKKCEINYNYNNYNNVKKPYNKNDSQEDDTIKQCIDLFKMRIDCYITNDINDKNEKQKIKNEPDKK